MFYCLRTINYANHLVAAMNLFFFRYVNRLLLTTNNRIDLVECPCPDELHDECTPKINCVYGINDEGEIFHNVKNDPMNLTKIAIQRKKKIYNYDDVIVNLYNPKMIPTVIFYYGCRECEDLKKLGNFTESKLKVFLLSLYNQRMKYNIKYSQSNFKYFSDPTNELQPLPEISVRPFWKNRLMFNQTCAHKQQGFTQKHYIPAFLTQDLCILDYKYIGHSETPQTEDEYHTNNGEIRYSLTLSYTDLYAYDILDNHAEGICKMSFNLVAGKQFMRFFCLCKKYRCTLYVTQMNPLRFCPYELQIEIDTTLNYTNIEKISDYMKADEFFMQSQTTADKYCFFGWLGNGTKYTGYVKITEMPLRVGYGFKPNQEICLFQSNQVKTEIEPILSVFYNNDSWELRKAFIGAIIDHSNLINDTYPVGANCTSEGPLSDPFYSSKYKSDSSMFPCYKYYEIDTLKPVYPMMGINVIPITVSKGKECYYYIVKKDEEHFKSCFWGALTPPIMTIVACPENITYDKTEIQRVRNVVKACPYMKANEIEWEYLPTKYGICGQFLRGIKLQNGKYIPDEIEFREVTDDDFDITGMMDAKVEHGCGFNASQTLTLYGNKKCIIFNKG
uniref:Uncharacterized protein n=1 Tax=Panagrolaimus sp. ES5 TaxID=591445 RepID=A0AC34GR12_9BILA